MTENNNRRKGKKHNKKGFTLVELLCAVAIVGIMTPVLINGFTFAAKLNYRSRLQQKADAAANDIYEGIASVKYEELGDYLSTLNGWNAISDNTGSGYEYYVSKHYDALEDCEVKVAVQKYSQSYIVPDLNLVGVKSKYLTLASEINDFDGVVTEKICQEVKSNESVKLAVKQDIIKKVKEKYGVVLDSAQVDGAKILVDRKNIDLSKISKETSITLGVLDGENFIADYSTKYRYPANVANPSLDKDSALIVAYTYAHQINGQWVSISNDSLNVLSTLRSYYNNSAYVFQFYVDGVSGTLSIPSEKDSNGLPVANSLFVYYNPLSTMDWINIKNHNSSLNHNLFFIEQKPDEASFLKLDTNASSRNNNFKFNSITRPTEDYTQFVQGNKVNVYSNNTNIVSKGIPDKIYESTEKEAAMYRVEVSVVYQSTVFANVSGNFQAGGGTVDKYRG